MPWWPIEAGNGPIHIDMGGHGAAGGLAPAGQGGSSRSGQGSQAQTHAATLRQGVMLHAAIVIGMNVILVLVLVLMMSNRKLTCHRAVVQCHGRHHCQHDGNDHPQVPPAAMRQPVTRHGHLNPRPSVWFRI
jgi:hypothetical protein